MSTTNHSLAIWESDSALLTNFRSQLTGNMETIDAALGLFSSLPTTTKANLVAAIAEIYAKLKATTDGASGANYIGATKLSDGSSASDVQTEIEYLQTEIQGVVLGAVSDNSISNDKLSTDNKVGSLAALTTTAKSNIVAALNEIDSDISGHITADKTLYASDETEVTVTGVTETTVKTFSIIKCSTAGLNPTKLTVVATLKTNNASGTAYLKAYLDGGGAASATLSTTSTSYVVVYSSAIDISAWSDNTVHTVAIKIYNGNGSYVTSNAILDAYVS